MTITLDLAPEDTEKLNGIAAQNGGDAESAARFLFNKALTDAASAHSLAPASQSTPASEWNAEFRAKYNIPADAQPLSAEDFVVLTPEEEDEAICLALDDSFAGHTTPLAEWSAKVRARHNLPEGVKAMSHKEAMLVP